MLRASVIWLLAIGEGISRKAQEQIEGLGAENIIVRSIKPPDDTERRGGGPKLYGVTRKEFDVLASTIPDVTEVLRIRELPYRFQNTANPYVKPIDGRLVGCTPEYKDVTRLEIDRGRFLQAADLEERSNYCVIAAVLTISITRATQPTMLQTSRKAPGRAVSRRQIPSGETSTYPRLGITT